MPLSGLRVAITADRKGAELQNSLVRLGADVVWGSTMCAVPPEVDNLLVAETGAVLAAAPAWFAVSTGSGLRAWLSAAQRSGTGEQVAELLANTQVLARGAKSHGALRAIGVEPVFVSTKETMDDVCSWLRSAVAPQDTIGAQVHGGEVIGTLDLLRTRERSVITVAPYRWVLPDDLAPARTVVRRILHGDIDVVAQTSAPSCRNLFLVADGLGLRRELTAVLSGTGVCVAAVGSVTARAFEEAGVAVDVMPQRPRTGDLLRAISHWALTRATSRIDVEDSIELVPSASAIRIGPSVIRLGRQEFAVLAAMVRRPGVVMRPDELALQAWGHRMPDNAKQVRHEIARLRRKLASHAGSIETVRNVGYRYRVR